MGYGAGHSNHYYRDGWAVNRQGGEGIARGSPSRKEGGGGKAKGQGVEGLEG